MNAEERAQRNREIVSMTRAGYSLMQIAEHFKITERTVVRVRRKYGISKPQPPTITAEEWARVEALLADGTSILEAARTIGRSHTPLWRRFRDRGWNRQQVTQYAAMCRKMQALCG